MMGLGLLMIYISDVAEKSCNAIFISESFFYFQCLQIVVQCFRVITLVTINKPDVTKNGCKVVFIPELFINPQCFEKEVQCFGIIALIAIDSSNGAKPD